MEQLKGFSLLLIACTKHIKYQPMQRSTSGKLNLVGIVELFDSLFI